MDKDECFKYSTLQFLAKPYHNIDIIPLQDDQDYGVCVLNVNKMQPIQKPILFHFMIDVSGSMSDITEKGRTKMQLLIHTLSNMVRYFANNFTNIFIQVKGFDDKIHDIIEKTLVSKTNLNELIQKLKHLSPLCTTNIELALRTMKNDIGENDTMEQVGIFLTDGEVTSGECDVDKLIQLIPQNINFHFIAFGHLHNDFLMHRLGHCTSYTNNWFINELEQAGNIYGEILYNELHKIFKNVSLTIENGLLFDYYKQDFVEELILGNIFGETEKHFHIVTSNYSNCVVEVQGTHIEDGQIYTYRIDDIPPLINMQSNEEVDLIFAKPFFLEIQFCRMITQIYMGKARKKLSTCKSLYENIFPLLINPGLLDIEKEDFRKKASKFLLFLEQYIEINYLEGNEFITCLRDDMNILLQTLAGSSLLKYSSIREDNQGQQRTNNAITYIHEDDITPTENSVTPSIARVSTTPYRTPGRVELMDSLSQDREDTLLFIDTDHEESSSNSTEYGTPPPIRRNSDSFHNANVNI